MARRLSFFIALALVSVLLPGKVSAQEPKDSLLSDFDLFIEYLTDTHPDPYTAFGGRPIFYSTVIDMRSALEANPSLSKATLRDSIASLIVKLHDGHTWISSNNTVNSEGDDLFAIGHIVQTQDSLFLSSFHKDNAHLLGARINKIGGVDVKKALDGAISKVAAENRFGVFERGFKPISVWRKKFSGIKDNVNLELISPSGDTVEYVMPLRPLSELDSFEYAGLPQNNALPRGLFKYKLIDPDKKIMAISVPAIAGRENFEYCYYNGIDFMNWMRSLYGYLDKEVPADTLEAIKGFPAYFDKFKDMLTEMKRDSVPYLVIDLRTNSGGWSPIVMPTLMLLYGDKYVKSTRDESEKYIHRISPLFLKKYNMTIDDYNKQQHTDIKVNDFTIGKATFFPDDSLAYYRDEMIDGFLLSDADKAFLKGLDGKPLYEPERVFVVTDPHTFSAAFHYTFFLSRAGAEVVGVTSSQAPNTFMESTNFTLPYSGIWGSISNSLQLLMPPNGPRSKEFTPDIPIDYATYRKYGFNLDTPINYIIDLVESY